MTEIIRLCLTMLDFAKRLQRNRGCARISANWLLAMQPRTLQGRFMEAELTKSENPLTADKRPRGRRPVDPKLKKVQITFTLSPQLLEKINQQAREHGLSRTAFISMALENACRRGLNQLTQQELIQLLRELKE